MVLVKICVDGMWKLNLVRQTVFLACFKNSCQNVRSKWIKCSFVKWNNFTVLFEPKAEKHYAVILVEHIGEELYEAQFMNESWSDMLGNTSLNGYTWHKWPLCFLDTINGLHYGKSSVLILLFG
jgi:hypothetical protein